jgi:3'-phosphoadenosine 5'-phosphosulfate sulfotransferase (PAPS reductase)/FAD synthetase
MLLTAAQLAAYDTIIVAFSGGKDSLACLLHLLDLGVDKSKIELWHHDVDGQEGSTLMDWRCTRDYCRAVAKAFDLPMYLSWKMGGFEREMGRDGTATAPVRFEQPDGTIGESGGAGPAGTRQKFPQVSPDLSVRWCSAYLKIDVCAAAIRNQARFDGKRTLVVTGERAEESASRAKYKILEPHRADRRDGRKGRHVDQYRPVHAWTEQQVWDIIARYGVNPHPAYRLGWGRVSCAACIFGSANQWASLREIAPAQFAQVAAYEEKSGKTIQRKLTVIQQADKGAAYATMSATDRAAALSETFAEAVILPAGTWKMPAGAFGESCGPV